MVSDVPFGAFLSGGLDSSTIVALMTRHNSQGEDLLGGLRRATATASSRYARAGGASTSAPTTTSWWSTPRDLIEHLPKLVAFRDAPVSEPSDIPIYMLAKEAAKSVKMVLTGEGSDEILGGYPKHVFERFAWGYQQLPGLRARADRAAHARCPTASAARRPRSPTSTSRTGPSATRAGSAR